MNNLVKTMSKKLKGKKGFTLIEMLIVVAIIAILVAIAVPVVNSSLEKSRQSADDSNKRAAQSVALSQYVSDGETTTVEYWYQEDGTVSKGSQGGSPVIGQAGDDKGKVLKVTVAEDTNKVTAEWVTKS